jgi:hypothetical protein
MDARHSRHDLERTPAGLEPIARVRIAELKVGASTAKKRMRVEESVLWADR